MLVILFFLLVTSWSHSIASWIQSLRLPGWATSSLFLIVLYGLGGLVSEPFAYLGGYRIDRAFGLTTQTPLSWAFDQAKAFALGLAAVVLAGDVLLWLLATQPVWWWTIAWALGILVTLVLGFLGPVVIAPLFYRFKPLEDAALRARYEALAAKAGTPVIGVFEMGASVKTRHANATVMGFGRTRRIIVTDTLVRAFSPEETETVLAHEMGHEHSRDLLIGVVVGAAFSFVMWSLAGWAYAASGPFFRFSLAEMAGLPLLVVWSAVISTALGPLELVYSREREARADRFALELTHDPAAFASAMVKLADRNLGVAHLRRWEKWLSSTHPSGEERVDAARAFASSAQSPG